ncbi:hypothetical protein LOS21_12880 [Enterococcus faecium]|nr:hypothetical protein [Enterococcus faecium]
MIKQSKQIKKRLPAVQLLALGFFLLILVGGGLLTLPFLVIVGMGQILSMRFSLQLLLSV